MITPPDTPVLPAAVDLIAIGLFALSGALSGTRERQTYVTVAFFALIAGVGGGTVRDLLIGAPVFWVHDRLVAPVCLAVAMIAWFTPVRWYNMRMLLWTDALGMAVYSVLGTIKALGWGVPSFEVGGLADIHDGAVVDGDGAAMDDVAGLVHGDDVPSVDEGVDRPGVICVSVRFGHGVVPLGGTCVVLNGILRHGALRKVCPVSRVLFYEAFYCRYKCRF